MWPITLAQVRAHVGRLIASCIAIIIAIGSVVATLVLSDTTKITLLKAVGARYVDAAAVIAPDNIAQGQGPAAARDGSGGGVLSAELVDAVAQLDGVAAVSADTETLTQVVTPDRAGSQSTAVESVASVPELRWQDLADGRLPTGMGEIAVSTQVGAVVGETVSVTTYDTVDAAPSAGGAPATRIEDVTVVGVVDLGNDPTADVQGRLYATPDQVAAWDGGDPVELRVAAEPGADLGAPLTNIRAAVQDLGLAATVATGEQAAENRAASFTRGAADLTTVLLVFAGLAVFVAGMVIANTFSVLLAQRTRELALLRCVGASARQVRRGVLAEAAITGFGASLLGVAVGVGLAAATSAFATQSDSVIPLSGLSVPLVAVWIGLALGTIVTLLAAVFPAVAATRVAPLAALRPTDHASIRSKRGLSRLALGLGLFVPGVSALGYGILRGEELIAIGGGALSALGMILLLQRVIPPVVAFAGRTVARLGGVPASLAAGNASRNPGRTAATATALLIGVTLSTAMIVGASSTKATAEAELLASYPTDVIVSTYGAELPDGLLGQLEAIDGVGNTLALSVIERRQENGLMRALGLTRGQLRGLLAWEALLVAGVAAVLGVVIGAAYGLAGTAAILGQVGEVIIDIPWIQLLAVISVASAAGVLASVLPARRAARTSPVAALAG